MATPDRVELKHWQPSAPVLCAWGVLLVVFGYAYWETIRFLVGTWWSQDDYHHCFFVPLFSLYLLWHRREMVDPLPTKGSWWCLPMFAAAAVIRFATVDLHYTIDHYSVFPFLVGLALCLGGWRALQWSWPAIGFLVFMIPLPGDVAVLLSHPLQRIATTFGVYAIQTLGIPAVAAGTTIELTLPPPLEVAEACSGIPHVDVILCDLRGGRVCHRAAPLGEGHHRDQCHSHRHHLQCEPRHHGGSPSRLGRNTGQGHFPRLCRRLVRDVSGDGDAVGRNDVDCQVGGGAAVGGAFDSGPVWAEERGRARIPV